MGEARAERACGKRFGMLFQGAALFDSLTVGENVGAAAARAHAAVRRRDPRAACAERLAWVGLEGVEDMKPASLSGGMHKRVGLARAIAMDPDYILYDEPTTGPRPDHGGRHQPADPRAPAAHRRHVDGGDARHAQRVARSATGWRCCTRDACVFTGTPDEAQATSDPLVRQFIEGRSEGPVAAV